MKLLLRCGPGIPVSGGQPTRRAGRPSSVRAFEAPQGPDFAKDPDVVKFLSDLKQYGNYPDMPAFPHCMWS